ncbi:tRNA preQ1(34) S-adenosylmethionine ribosyltransferase-isomerase QueA [bacterium F11]|nr:tRNA preQ1(34) S-adenosylmethionine ribosyltransferase-isomerase QueA [bacterium F11]
MDPDTLDFELPENLIAQEPLPKRDHARLMVLDRVSGSLQHKKFFDLKNYLKKDDVVVINKARVNRAKFIGKKLTGGHVEIVLIAPEGDPLTWRSLVRPMLKPGTVFKLTNGVGVRLIGRNKEGENILVFDGGNPRDLMASMGAMPLPPYIKRKSDDPRRKKDFDDYQTVYGEVDGSLAAPTAGLHFTPELLADIKSMGVTIVEVILHVGWGTFRPIRESVENHHMLPEQYEISTENIGCLMESKKRNRRIISVGTTSTRVLESLEQFRPEGPIKGETNLFIKPGFSYKWITGLITNFHVPRSTPIALTAAFSGLSHLEKAYEEAIGQQYRFFSYGDAMLII